MTSTLINYCCSLLFLLTSLFIHAQSTDLNLAWEFSLSGSEQWNPAQVPGSVYTDLMRINTIPDPFVGTMEDSVQWVGKAEWTYRSKTFDIDTIQLRAERLILRFPQLDAPCEIWFNGKRILKADNAFRTWEADIKKWAKQQGNQLEIRFKSPVNEADLRAKKYGFLPTGEARVFIRKAPYQFGWDWGPALPGAGIGALPVLCAINKFEIQQVAMHTLSIHPDYAQMDMQIKIFAEERMGVSINLLIHGEKEDYGKFYLEKGSHIYHYVFTVERPKLWWCHDQGYPHLYDYTLEISGRSVEQQWSDVFGIRTIELITEKSDSSDVGESFYFKLNGRPIFAKGANYIPQDVFPHRVAELQYGNLLQEAVNSNMNMLRVWGGGIYEKEIFYDLCDYKGILVWQDYMFACAMYPGDKKFIANVKAEAEEQSLRIGSHPCVALFCGNNEIAEGWARWGWKDPLKKAQIEKLQKAYDSIFEDVLRNATNNYTQCDYWPSSPMLGRGDPLHTTVGDAHYWGVWHDAEPFENFRKKVPRFMSEFGFQSYPSLQTLLKIDPVEENLFVGSEALANHQKHSRGDKLIADYMAQWLDAPTSFEKFLYQSQFVQAEGMRIGLDAHLAAWPYCGGTLYWQYNDCWPAVSWSSRDYYGNWKMMQYMVREAFKPLRVIAIPIDDKTTRVYIHNHSPFAQQVLFTAQYMGLNDAFSVQEGELSDIYCEAGKNTFVGDFVIESSENDTAAHYWLFELQSEFGNDRRIHLLEEIASYISAPNDYEVSFDKMGDTRIIKMSADKFEMGVWLECSGTGVFSDNYFNLIPGEEMGILFESEERDLNFTIRSLGGGIIRSFDEKDFRQVLPGE